jgi:MerR family transcriptional regulator, light-induced transcriptional regulator
MYKIKQAAARTGMSEAVLRAWERRYGVVMPERTPAGYRLYDDEDLERLNAMRRLVDDGWSPSAAAAVLTEGTQGIEARGVGDDIGGSRPTPPGPTPADSDARARFVGAAASLDAAGVEQALDEMLASGSFDHVAQTRLLPALRALGDAWAGGRLDVAGEHAASHAALRRLGAAFESAGRAQPGQSGGLLVGLPPGARHELGALAFAVVARRSGLVVTYLGADLPADDWVEAAIRRRAGAAVIGAVTADDVLPAERVADALRAARPNLLIAVGGAASAGVSATGVLHLPDDLVAAADLVAATLRRPAAQ